MTKSQKIRPLFAILECSPATHSMTAFESAARTRDLSSFWAHYQTALGQSKQAGPRGVKSSEEITLEMLEPAMNAVYELPTSDGAVAAVAVRGRIARLRALCDHQEALAVGSEVEAGGLAGADGSVLSLVEK